MRRSNYALVSAAALGLAVLVAGPASAAPAPTDILGAAQSQAYPGEAYAQHRRGGGVRHGGGGGMRHVGGHRHGGGFRGGRGAGAAALGVGLAAGLIGAAIAAQQPAAPTYGGGGPGWNRYCFRRFGASFDPGSGTYLGADGYRYPCQ